MESDHRVVKEELNRGLDCVAREQGSQSQVPRDQAFSVWFHRCRVYHAGGKG